MYKAIARRQLQRGHAFEAALTIKIGEAVALFEGMTENELEHFVISRLPPIKLPPHWVRWELEVRAQMEE
jgi:hypothetical protein